MIFVGDDWAEDHHDVHVMDADGAQLASRRLPEGLPGISGFHKLVATHAEEPSQVVIGIETDRGLWVQALGAAGYQVYAVNPLAAWRRRHRISRRRPGGGRGSAPPRRRRPAASAGVGARPRTTKPYAACSWPVLTARERHRERIAATIVHGGPPVRVWS